MLLGLFFSLLCCNAVNGQLPANIIPRFISYARPAVTPEDPTIMLHTLRYVTFAWFEVWATCNDTAVGPLFLGSLRRTNQNVNCTLNNKNTAYAYAAYQVMSQPLYADLKASFNAMMVEFGLDPSNNSTDASTPIGLGNKIGIAVRNFMARDGMNSQGDLGTANDSGTFYGIPYADYTSTVPIQTAYQLWAPDRWQPQVEPRLWANGPFGRGVKISGNSGIQSIQTYATPQLHFTAAFGYNDSTPYMKKFGKVYARYFGGGEARRAAYLQQAATIIAASANLTDKDKIEAEFFESKNLAFGTPLQFLSANSRGTISGQTPWTVDDWAVWEFLINAAVWDATVVAWSVKRKRDAVRPVTAVRYLYADQTIYSWGGPGKGNVYQSGAAFKTWLRTMPHTEYPSGSSCMCAAFAEANRQWFGNDNFYNFAFPVTQGSSSVEPGFVPAVNMTVGPFSTFTQYAQVCGQSRLAAGVHFQQSINDALEVCPKIAINAGALWRKYLQGTVTKAADPNNHPKFVAPDYIMGTDVSLDDNDN